AMQVKLLRVLQEGTFYPVGGREQQKIDIRLVSATNANLPDLVKQGKFREDLYYRIKGVTIETVALDERREDIPLLIQFFLEQLSAQYGQKLQLESAAISWFLQKHWPGNVRELKNTLESVAAIAQEGVIRVADIQLLHLEHQILESDTELVLGSDLSSLDEQVKALEIRLIQQAMAQYKGNKSQASRVLGISRQGLLKKIERYGLTDLGDD
ncbi:MAG: sigma 54-interacting transcriptional regulator, partial [Pararheinheimera sp.]|nr:sigma 54-interacting transcriptional regulator [Rheinheimera sp.]